MVIFPTAPQFLTVATGYTWGQLPQVNTKHCKECEESLLKKRIKKKKSSSKGNSMWFGLNFGVSIRRKKTKCLFLTVLPIVRYLIILEVKGMPYFLLWPSAENILSETWGEKKTTSQVEWTLILVCKKQKLFTYLWSTLNPLEPVSTTKMITKM